MLVTWKLRTTSCQDKCNVYSLEVLEKPPLLSLVSCPFWVLLFFCLFYKEKGSAAGTSAKDNKALSFIVCYNLYTLKGLFTHGVLIFLERGFEASIRILIGGALWILPT